MGDNIDAYRVLTGRPEGDYLKDLALGGMTILKLIFKK
jgi:hypothetical protein